MVVPSAAISNLFNVFLGILDEEIQHLGVEPLAWGVLVGPRNRGEDM